MTINLGNLFGQKKRTIVHVASPVSISALGDTKGEPVRIVIRGQLNSSDAILLGEHFQDNDHVTVCISSFGEAANLDFLEYFPSLKALDIQNYEFDDFQGLSHLPRSIDELNITQTKSKKLSLSFLEHHQNLKKLAIESHTKSIESISSLVNLEELTLRSITLKNLEFLTHLRSLLSLDIKLGGTKNLDALPLIGKIRYLELWQISGLTNLNAIAQIQTLQFLYLDRLKNVSALPSFRNLLQLRRVELHGMKGITDIHPVAEAPNLQELAVGGVRHLDLTDFEPLLEHHSLRAVNIGLGSHKRNEAVEKLLVLPAYETPFAFHDRGC